MGTTSLQLTNDSATKIGPLEGKDGGLTLRLHGRIALDRLTQLASQPRAGVVYPCSVLRKGRRSVPGQFYASINNGSIKS